MATDESDEPLPLRSMLTRPVIVTLANYAMLAFLGSVLESYFPLVWSTPVKYGGLNLNPASIGMWLSLYGGMDGIFQFFFFSLSISRFGHRRVFVFSIVSSAVILAIFPFENLTVVAGGGPNLVVWLLVIMQLSSYCVLDMGYGEFFVPYTLAHADTHDTWGHLYKRYNVHLRFICYSQQTIARCGEWPHAGGDFHSECCWTSCCRLTICILPDV